MDIITIDFETYWDSKNFTLSKIGPIAYVRDPRFATQLMGVRVNRGPVNVYEPHEIPQVLASLELHKPGRRVVGHNMNGFDALILSEIYRVYPYEIVDTQTMMRWVGVARIGRESHAALTSLLKTGEKRQGTVISDGKQWPHEFSVHEREDFKKYCAEDVLQCSENYYALAPYVTEDAFKFSSMTAKMATMCTLQLDVPLLNAYAKELQDATDKARDEIATMFRLGDSEAFLKAMRSAKVYTSMLRQLGVEAPVKLSDAKTKTAREKLEEEVDALRLNCTTQAHADKIKLLEAKLADPTTYEVWVPALSKTDFEFTSLRHHDDPRVATLVQCRLDNNSSIVQSRVGRFLEVAATGKPLPVMLGAYKAHTSRYTAGAGDEGASDGLNLQNLSKRNPSQLTLRRSIKAPPGYKLVSCDSSQIEARMNAYAARQDDLLYTFLTGGDPYSDLAGKCFNNDPLAIKAGAKAGDKQMVTYRNVGKKGILSAGFGVSAGVFSRSLLNDGARLHDNLDKHHELAAHAHAVYRISNARIVQFWAECMTVIKHMEAGGSGTFGGPTGDLFQYGSYMLPGYDTPVPSVYFPSGYAIRYPNLRQEKNDNGRTEYVYDQHKGRSVARTKLYGGKLCENLIQGISFQLMMWQVCRIQESNIHIVGNVHDSWIALATEQHAEATLQVMQYWMSQVPPWLPGFPVACEGEIGDDYTIA